MRDKIIIMKDWLDQCENLPEEEKKEFYYYIIRSGIYEEKSKSKNPMMNVLVNQIAVQIKRMSEFYNQSVEVGKNGGRPKKANDDLIFELASSGLNSKQIEEETGIKASTVRSSKGWKRFKELGKEKESDENYFEF